MNKLRLLHKGYWAGDFVVTTEDCSFSIGDYIEVILTEKAHIIDEVIKGFRGEDLHIAAFPLTITECCHSDEIKVILQSVMGVACRHWYTCLEVGQKSMVVSNKYETNFHTWYMPKIDGRALPFGAKA